MTLKKEQALLACLEENGYAYFSEQNQGVKPDLTINTITTFPRPFPIREGIRYHRIRIVVHGHR